MVKKSGRTLSVGVKSIAVMLFLLCISSNSYSETIWESEDTLYNLSLIGFFHIDVADFDVDPVADAGLPIDEGFQSARAIAHFSSRLGQRFSAFLEAELSALEDEFKLEVERIVVKYDIDDNSQISLGRFHAPVGFWNQSYHHGRWLQVSKDRPLQTEFGGTFLPGHYWGGMYERRFSTPSRTINLDIGLGAGRDTAFAVPGFASTIDSDRAFMAQINVVPAGRKGLTFGGSLWIGNLYAEGLPDVDERVLTAHVNYVWTSDEILAEVSVVQHDYADALGKTNNYGSYLQYSRRLAARQGRFQPYFRVDYLDMDAADFVYSGLRSSDRETLGLRYDVSNTGAIKLEVRHDNFRDSDQSVNSIQVQYSSYFQ